MQHIIVVNDEGKRVTRIPCGTLPIANRIAEVLILDGYDVEHLKTSAAAPKRRPDEVQRAEELLRRSFREGRNYEASSAV